MTRLVLTTALTGSLLAAASCSRDDTGGATSFATGATDDDAEGSATAEAESGTDNGDGDGDSGDGDGDSGDGDGDSGDGDGDGGDGDGDDVKFDTLAPDGGTMDCECGNDEFSYVWIANSGESTVSKVNTRTVTEEGRYLTRSDADGNPSRTSVSIDARAVAVANRHGGITKIWAQEEDCEDTNGMPGIQTSTGANDVLAWGADECVAWHTDFPGLTTQRPVQWTPGVLNEETCDYDDQKIWTVGGKGGASPGQCGADGVWVYRLDGASGVIEDELHIPENDFPCGPDPYAPYGGIADLEQDFWFISRGGDKLVEVDYDTLDYEVHTIPFSPYGITLDTKGRIWTVCGTDKKLGRYDPDLDQWDIVDGVGLYGGIGQAPDGTIWTADYTSGIASVDPDTLEILDTFQPPGAGQVKGVSVDIDGYVWVIRRDAANAFKVDPADFSFEEIIGFNKAYTYSDMTGGIINNITCHPEG